MDWISVKDRLPPKNAPGVRVIVDGKEHVAYFEHLDEQGIGLVGGWEFCHMCGGSSQITFDPGNKASHRKNPTHWAPLSELPQ